MIGRICRLPKTHSFFLFGPRGVGKTTMLEAAFKPKDSVFVDLLDINLFDQLMLDPSRFEALIDSPENRRKRVVIDEIQKFPRLLDVAHRQIQKRKRQFVFTGSSSRRLKQQGVNLLAGRAYVFNLYPFTTAELGKAFDLKKALQWGTFPDAFLAPSPEDAREFLGAYVATYLQKEILQEQWVRNLLPFRRFLAVAAQMNGQIVNKSSLASEAGVDDVTVAHYFEILEDTLLGFMLPAYHVSVRKAQRQAPKFYFIDPGLKRALDKTLGMELLPRTFAWGEAFEHWVILEIFKNASYKRLDWSFSYVRTKEDVEIDLVVVRPGERLLLIEIKSKDLASAKDAKALETLGGDLDPKAEKWLISNDPLERKFGYTLALHWREAMRRLFA